MSLKLNIHRDELLTGLSSVQNVTGKKGTIAILSNVLLQTEESMLILTGTDLEVGIRNKIPAEIITSGNITLPSRKFFEIVRETPSDSVKIEILENNQALIKAGKSEYSLSGTPVDEFPAFPEYKEENLVYISSELISSLIDKTSFCMASEGESQFNLNGALFMREENEGNYLLRMVTTDGHRLSLMEKHADESIEKLTMNKNIIIPRKGLQEIRKFCDLAEEIGINFEEKQAVVKTGNSLLIIRLMQGDFPDFSNIFGMIKKDHPLSINREIFIQSMKRMNLFVEDKYNAVQFDIKANNMILSSQNIDLGNAKDELAIEYGGDDLNLGFNGRYFLEAMQVMHSEKIKAYIDSVESPCLIEGDEDEGFKSIIMPMKI